MPVFEASSGDARPRAGLLRLDRELIAIGILGGLLSGLLGVGGGIVMAVGGALLALALPGSTLRIVFAVFVGLVGVKMMRDSARTKERQA